MKAIVVIWLSGLMLLGCVASTQPITTGRQPASGFEPTGHLGPEFPNQTLFDAGVGAYTPR